MFVRITLLCLILLYCFHSHSQFSTIPGSSRLLEPERFLPTNDGGFVGIKRIQKKERFYSDKYNSTFSLVRYDANMKRMKEQPLFGGDFTIVPYAQLFSIGNKSFLIYCEPLQKNRFTNFMAMEVNPETLQTGAPILIAEEGKINETTFFTVLSTERNVNFQSSPNAKHHVLLIDDGNKDFFLTCLNDQLKPVWSGKYKAPEFSQDYMSSLAVDDGGLVYMSYTDGEKGSNSLSVYDKNGSVSHRALSFGTIKPSEIKLLPQPDGTMSVAGPFTENTGNCIGVYKGQLDKKTFGVEKIQGGLFTASMIELAKKHGLGNTKESKYGVEPDKIHSAVFQTPTNFWIVLEWKSKVGGGKALSEGSLMIADLDAKDVAWSFLPRYTVMPYVKPKGPHYFAAACPDKISLFYIDHSDNLSLRTVEEPTVLNNNDDAIVMVATINKAGLVVKKRLPLGALSISEAVSLFHSQACKLP